MRHLLFPLLFFIFQYSAFSQSNGIGVGTASPHESAQLDVSSTNKGFLPPRMTFAQRTAISNPAMGLIIYCTDCGSIEGELQYFNGSNWLAMTSGPAQSGFSTVIGTQTWMKKNLDVAKYRDGTPIPQITSPSQWQSATSGAWCWYNNDSATYAATYGRLYNWYATVDSRGLCPAGWHVPSAAEWTTLANFLGGSFGAGGALKSTTGWTSPNTGASNSTGFSALPCGGRNCGGYQFGVDFQGVGEYVNFWSTSTSSFSIGYASIRQLYYNNMEFYDGIVDKCSANAVRCVKD